MSELESIVDFDNARDLYHWRADLPIFLQPHCRILHMPPVPIGRQGGVRSIPKPKNSDQLHIGQGAPHRNESHPDTVDVPAHGTVGKQLAASGGSRTG